MGVNVKPTNSAELRLNCLCHLVLCQPCTELQNASSKYTSPNTRWDLHAVGNIKTHPLMHADMKLFNHPTLKGFCTYIRGLKYSSSSNAPLRKVRGRLRSNTGIAEVPQLFATSECIESWVLEKTKVVSTKRFVALLISRLIHSLWIN